MLFVDTAVLNLRKLGLFSRRHCCLARSIFQRCWADTQPDFSASKRRTAGQVHLAAGGLASDGRQGRGSRRFTSGVWIDAPLGWPTELTKRSWRVFSCVLNGHWSSAAEELSAWNGCRQAKNESHLSVSSECCQKHFFSEWFEFVCAILSKPPIQINQLLLLYAKFLAIFTIRTTACRAHDPMTS